jgi:tRNA(Arg) A34 adenosine deaminase TadA
MQKPLHMGKREDSFMQLAIDLSWKAMSEGKGGPFGAIVVHGEEVIGRGCNQVLSGNDPTAHAEIIAIREACKTLGSFLLEGCEIYTSCEPCPMCLGAIYWSRAERVYYANSRSDAEQAGFDDAFIYREISLTPSERRLPMLRMQLPGAVAVFEEWTKKYPKTVY